MNATDCARRI